MSIALDASTASFPAADPPRPEIARRSFSLGGVLKQVHHDAFGTKDVQDAPTLTYTWSADQFGHFNLGLVGSLLVAMLMVVLLSLWDEWQGTTAGSNAEAWGATVAGLVVAGWFANKERDDFAVAVRNACNVFPFNRRELALNVQVACFYTFAGIGVLVAAFWIHWWAALVMLALLAINVPVALWWLRRKIAFQQADLPYLYRLANFPDNFERRSDVELIRALADPKTTPIVRHIIIDGPLSAGKTSLAVGVGTDFAFNMGLARFISLVKLNQYGVRARAGAKRAKGLHEGTEFRDGRTLWPLEDVDLLVVDDLDIGLAHPDPIDPRVVEDALLQGPGREFFAAFRDRRTFWIAGTSDHIPQWRQVVADLVTGGDVDAIRVVRLKGALRDALAPRR